MACVEGEGSDIVVDSYEVVETEVVFEETSCSEDTDDELSRTSLHLLSESAPNLKQHLAEKVVEPRSFEQKMCVTPTSPINDDGKDRYSDSTESDVTSLAGTAKFTAICHDGENSSHTLGTTISGSLSLGECQSLLRLSSTNSFDSRSETEGTESEKVESENENSETGESDEPESEDETTENLADATIRQLTVTDRLDAPIHPQREESANLHSGKKSYFRTDEPPLGVPWFKKGSVSSTDEGKKTSPASNVQGSVPVGRFGSLRRAGVESPHKISSWFRRSTDIIDGSDAEDENTEGAAQSHDDAVKSATERPAHGSFLRRQSTRAGVTRRFSHRNFPIKRLSERTPQTMAKTPPPVRAKDVDARPWFIKDPHTNTCPTEVIGAVADKSEQINIYPIAESDVAELACDEASYVKKESRLSQFVSGLTFRHNSFGESPSMKRKTAERKNRPGANLASKRPSFFEKVLNKSSASGLREDMESQDKKHNKKQNGFVRFASLRKRLHVRGKDGTYEVFEEDLSEEESSDSQPSSGCEPVSENKLMKYFHLKKARPVDEKTLTYGMRVPFKDMDLTLIEATGVSVIALSKKALNQTKTARSLLRKTYTELTHTSLKALNATKRKANEQFKPAARHTNDKPCTTDGLLFAEMQLRVAGAGRKDRVYRETVTVSDEEDWEGASSEGESSVEVVDLEEFLDEEMRLAMHHLQDFVDV